METITSTKNPKVKKWFKLKNNNTEIKRTNQFIVEGNNLINEAFLNNLIVDLLIVDKNMYENLDVNKIIASKKVIDKLSSNKTNNGAIAICKYHQFKYNLDDFKKIVVLDGVNNPGNLGTIVRTAKALNFEAVVLINEAVFYLNDKVIKASQGAIFNFPVFQTKLELLKEKFYPIHFLLDKNGQELEKIKQPSQPFALVFGNEANGISKKTLESWKGIKGYIKLFNDVESLNLSAAAAIAINKYK